MDDYVHQLPLAVKHADDEPYADILIQSANGIHVAKLYQDDAPCHDYNAEQRRMARLFTAAPELLAACEDILARNEIQNWFNVDKCRAAVSMAKGN